MVTEFRRLVFSSTELKRALKAFSQEKAPKLPDGEIIGMVIDSAPQICARLRMDIADGADEQEVEVEASYLGAAMLYHCIRNRIPVPKSTPKTVERAGDGLALSFSINANPQRFDDGGK